MLMATDPPDLMAALEASLAPTRDARARKATDPLSEARAHPAPAMERDPYAASLMDEQAVKAALTAATVKRRADELAHDARFALAHAGIEGRTVRVQVWVGDGDCGLVIVPVGAS